MQQQGLGIDMRRIAFIGIENADSEVLHDALRRNLGADAEINAFGRDVAAVTVAPFLVAKSKESGQLEGGNSVAYISGEADADLAKKISRLHKAGVTVRTGWSDFKPDAPEEDIGQWLATGEWPLPAPEPEPEDDEDDLLALLLEDDDDDDEDEVLASTSSNESTTNESDADEAEDDASPASEPAQPAVDADDELMELAEPVVAPVYQSRRFDSMGANDGAVQPPRRRETAPVEQESFEDDEDDLPLPSFTSAPVSSGAEEVRPVSFSDDEDDELPAFGVQASADDEEDGEDLPVFNAAPREELPSLRAVDSSDEDSEDELPAFTSSPKSESVADAQKVEFSDDDSDDEDELPSWYPNIAAKEDVKEEEEETSIPSYLRPANQESKSAPVAPSFDDADDDDELPVFRAPSVASSRSNTEAASSRRAARELPVDSGDDDDDELPVFTPVARDRTEASSYEKPQAPSYARPPVELDEEEDLPVFRAPAPVSPVEDEDDFFSGGSDEEDLPVFTAPAATEELPPLRRSRRDILQAAESLAVSDSKPSVDVDDDGEDLPVFTAVQPEEDDDLPAPVRRASPVSDDERGDDLPDFAARAVKPVSAVEDDEDEEAEEESFEFAPKVKTPRYAAPVEKQPSWGMPVQRPEPVVQPEPVRQEPARKVAPEKVRYEDDNPAEVIAELAKRRREAEGYTQPEIETDVPDRELRPAPGAVPELRKAPKRVVNQRPAAPIEDESLNFMGGQDTTDDFNPDATPPFMESLQPEQRRAQSTMEKIRREYDSESIMKVRSKGSAVCYYVTGSHGGAGKTTSTWMMANTMAAALKKDPSRPVFLIEGDYENSKLAQRLNLPPEKNSGRLAELYRTLSSDRSLISKQKINMFEMTEKIIKESIYVNDHGVNIIAAPYDLTKRDGRFLRIAIQKSVEYAERQGGYVFIDADTLSNDDILDRTLAAKATHVVLVSFGDKDHVDDTHRAIHTLTTANVKSVAGTQSNGMGVPKDRIKLFFNKTGTDRFEDLQRTMRPYLTEGHLPTVPGLNDGGWIGNLTGSDFLNAVTSYASFMNRISPMEELRPYQQRKPGKTTQRSSFMKMFGSRRG